MGNNRIKRVAKRVLDVSLVPLARYAFGPLAAQQEQLFGELGSHVAQLDLRLRELTAALANERWRHLQPELRRELAELRAATAQTTANNPSIFGFKVYAQTDEDGIIENILDRLPDHSRTFIEIGCGSGLENNTHYLALKGYRGCWLDGSSDNIDFIGTALGGLDFKYLQVRQAFVDVDNIGSIVAELCRYLGTSEPGFFSLDIDGNDLVVLQQALTQCRPLVLGVEYNAKFPPPLRIVIEYNPQHRWAGDDYHGASLQALCDGLPDYKLVACNLSGVNAFFVRWDLAGQFPNYSPPQLYQPFRENLVHLQAEHSPSLRWLRDKLRAAG